MDLDTRVDKAIAACDGDARAAVRALIILTDHLQADLAAQTEAASRLAEGISRGFMRGRW
ncbi:hypothetical protein J8I29_19260 [Labrys sp. LIt4]|nr:hypothetical protein [Labrys sp. LIt4]